MKIQIIKIFFSLFILSYFVSACSSSEETTKKEDVYVFDEVKPENTIEAPETGDYPDLKETYYVVQIGAFTTKERAEEFADFSRRKLSSELAINVRGNLYVVQIVPFYKSRQEAEIVRDNLWQIPEFNDAWILTINR